MRIFRKSLKKAVPQPPHVLVIIREKTVGIVAAVLDIVKAAAVDGRSRVSRSGTGESVHKRALSAAVGAAFTHAAAGGTGRGIKHTLGSPRVNLVMKIGASSACSAAELGKRDRGAESEDLPPSRALSLNPSLLRTTYHHWKNVAVPQMTSVEGAYLNTPARER